MTAKGATYQLSAKITPANTKHNALSWSSDDTSVATVDQNGKVTAVGNGYATITCKATDTKQPNNPDLTATCSVTVKIPEATATPTSTSTPNPSNVVETVNLAGGDSKILSVWNEDYTENIDVSKITFEYHDSNDTFSNLGQETSAGLWSRITVKAQKQGSVAVLAKYNGRTLKRWNVNVTSNWSEYMGYVAWRKDVESQIWNSNMSTVQKLDAAKDYIKSHFAYKLGSDAAVYAYKGNVADCITASEFMGDFAKDISCTVRYYNANTGKHYDYIVDAYSASGGHIFCHILLNDQWVIYDASNLS